MEPRTEPLRVGERETTMTFYPAKRGFARLVLAPGAGANQATPFLARIARDLAARGVDVTTFDFFYAAAKRRAIDPPAKLEACYRAVIDRMPAPVFVGGKSMGGRIASQVVAAGAPAAGLVFLGYPLHPPGKPEVLRTAHWPKVGAPALFVQGTRDPFGGPAELAPHLPRLGAEARVLPIEGGDHSLAVPKRGATPQADVDESIRATIVAWMREVLGGR